MYFKDVLKRANLHAVEFFLRNGGETFAEVPPQSYRERLAAAETAITNFLEARYPDPQTFDRVWQYLGEHLGTMEDVYFEMGMLVGAKLAFQLRGKMDELQ